ncbi:prepilin-type N-terminal cleavage/methylation domain-containing protein [Sporosarcina sp. ANT_H38]|uniref:PilW family protein n=1 Tax=Sporosarcina sp. ANT_H38 TaxID=2597358 RepID=UPI0011F3F095|nr:prepilin-type N-terminal cleavage/methylation domain-containing protein [Sporosarcina sp. ANT_H38]KAA0965336.1 prepilin-type N-terminal cleavage/methylation domain-containing protein [Sporosarcina sp. ANT_H38]
MRKYLNNEKGLTLVEILAVLIIGSIIMLLISNVHLFGQKQYKSQSEKSRHLYDVTYAAKVITKEIRKVDESGIANVDSKRDHIKLTSVIEYKYNSANKSIENKDGTILVKDIENFVAERLDNQVDLEIISKTGEKVKTKIVLRKGD